MYMYMNDAEKSMKLSCSIKAEIFVINNDNWRNDIDLYGKIWNINTLLKFNDTLIFRESNMQVCDYVDKAPQTCVLNAYSLLSKRYIMIY